MTDNAFPLPGVTTVSTITDWENLFAPGFETGVVPGNGNELAPTLDTSGRNAVIDTGNAIIRAFCKPVSVSTATAIPAASSQDRIDRLVLRLDRSASVAANFIQPVVITGTPGSSPALPALTQTPTGLWDLPIAHWTSKSTGALTGLADERYFAGNSDWHSLAPYQSHFSLPVDGFGKYRRTRDNELQISAALAVTGGANPNTLNTNPLPPAYIPASTAGNASSIGTATRGGHWFPVAAGILAVPDNPNNAGPRATISSDGYIVVCGISTNGPNLCGIEVKIPLDL
jgi:hypothetical protein